MIHVYGLQPDTVQVIKVLVRSQESGLAHVSSCSNPQVVVRHRNRRLRRSGIARRIDGLPMSPSVDPGIGVQDGLSIDVERRKPVKNVLKVPATSTAQPRFSASASISPRQTTEVKTIVSVSSKRNFALAHRAHEASRAKPSSMFVSRRKRFIRDARVSRVAREVPLPARLRATCQRGPWASRHVPFCAESS